MKRTPSPKTVAAWQDAINQNGTKRIKARTLLKQFGFQRRGPKAVACIFEWFKMQKPRIYPNGLKWLESLDGSVHLAFHDLRPIGLVAERESMLTDLFEEHIMPKLKGKLRNPKRDFSPEGTRDRLDFLCTDKDGRSVAVELKREDGERRGVEQLLTYIRHLRRDSRTNNPRGILITGYADLPTRRAMEELSRTDEIAWYVYGVGPSDGEIEVRLKEITVKSVHGH